MEIQKEIINSILEDFIGFKILGIQIEIETLFWALYLWFSDEHKALNFGNFKTGRMAFCIYGEVMTV